MVGDLTETAGQIDPLLRDAFDVARRGEASETLAKLADTMATTSSYFEFRSLNALVQLLRDVGLRLPDVPEASLPELLIRVRGIASLIQQHAAALAVSMETNWGLDTLIARTRTLLDAKPLDPAIAGWHKGDVDRLLELDRVTEGIEPPPSEGGPPSGIEPGSWSPLPATQSAATDTPASPGSTTTSETTRADDSGPVMRVECSAMDRLQDTIGQLVQNKNRLLRLPSRLASSHVGADLLEDLTAIADQIDRLAGELQSTVLSARMQPLHRLFDRYPRIVRDVARINEREIELHVVGAETRVDKSAFDALGDPITFLMRFAASKSIETPAERTALGKPPTGHITLAAVNQGGQVTITIEDDGSGLPRERLLAPALASGLLTPEQAQTMPDEEVYALACGDDVPESPLAGLAALVERQLGARLRISSTPGQGCTFTLVIPLKSAIVAAVMAQVGQGVYAIPLQAVTEIIRPEESQRSSIRGRECLRVRDHVFGVIDLHAALNESAGENTRPCAVMIRVGNDSAALLVDGIVGKQEIVIKPLERGDTGRDGPFTGATIRDDGRVSLIIDVERLVHQAKAIDDAQPAHAAA
jgi:two-component system chemotaxis sensor kinase CheA